MIVTSFPDLPPAPETAANAPFRRWFYERWGRENAIVCGRATRAEYATLTQTLSIKMAGGGGERYFLPHREVVVDDDNLLILNDGSSYGSLLKGHEPVWSFSVFFRPGMQSEVQAGRAQRGDEALDDPEPHAEVQPFSEHLRPHDSLVTPRLAALRAAALGGERDEQWLEEQLLLLLDAMLAAESLSRGPLRRLSASRRATRLELARRLRLAADHIESCHAEPLTLDAMARAACLSRYHFVRHFHAFFGVTPHEFLLRKRTRSARRLLARGELDRDTAALLSGFGSRTAMWRALRRFPANLPLPPGGRGPG